MHKREKCCCFTGHRPQKLPWGSDEWDWRCVALKERILLLIRELYREGYRHFITGMALGIDTYCCEMVLRLKEELTAVKQRCDALETAQFETLAAQYDGVGSVLLMQPAMESDAVRRLCDMVAARCCGRCAVFSGEDGAYKYAVIHPGADIRELIKTMNTALNGRGGGRDGFAQGSAACTEADIRSFFGGLN